MTTKMFELQNVLCLDRWGYNNICGEVAHYIYQSHFQRLLALMTSQQGMDVCVCFKVARYANFGEIVLGGQREAPQ